VALEITLMINTNRKWESCPLLRLVQTNNNNYNDNDNFSSVQANAQYCSVYDKLTAFGSSAALNAQAL